MIIYFHLSKKKGKNRVERPPKPWIANWTKEQLVKRMNEEREETLGILNLAETKEKMRKKEKKQKEQEIKKQKKGRRAQHRLRRQKLPRVTLLPLSLKLKKTRRIRELNTPAKRGKKWTQEKESRGKRSQILIQNLNLNQVTRAKNHLLRRRRRKRKKQKQLQKKHHKKGKK
ncbi:regulator of rDNA transcription 14 isoform X1 [Arachis duranensis]|uniref:Regulator of rDNA transcription 14 isoform X1 n=1 Tax=Arachis duranensis TaxID=130453 RepID=A0A6P5MTG1_ARADU|nr:regulator of rDNA transcription 14 isoform X1 [Arachis duranensis]